MKLTLDGCKHGRISSSWGREPLDETDENYGVTCLICYERLTFDFTDELLPGITKRNKLRPAPPAPMCDHHNKHSIEKPVQFRNDNYYDALCEDCGVALRHPNGPGHWDEIVFNGYLIREEP